MRRISLIGCLTMLTALLFAAPAHAVAPTVTLTSPLPGPISGIVTLDAVAAAGTTRVDYFLDGRPIAYDATCCLWDETWDSTTAADGGHALTAQARSSAGEIGVSSTVPVTVDNVAEPPPADGGGGYACVGAPDDAPVVAYPWPTTFVEAQAWWMPTRAGQTGNDFGHAHVGSCIPERETITAATIPIDIRVTLHDNPGKLIYVGVVVKGTSYENTVAKLYDPTLVGQRDGTVSRWLHYDLPLSAFHSSGLQEIRYRLFVSEPNTTDITHASLNFQTNIANGAPVANVTRLPFLRLKGWYSGAGYCESWYRSDLTPLPSRPVSGTWSPQFGMISHGTSTDRPVTHDSVRIDPDFHALPPFDGLVLFDADGQWEGQLPIDTMALADGRHRLVLKADCDDPRATLSGVGVIGFDVANGGSTG